ncbi:sporulation transcriptional regulator SpoIIID [Clostridium sp. HBUAS56017]|uniref:sporulation transcriptional regulator SpoIIID n=1 Tax=Clostridium sp. HBUAS56017 TaxID=2571128 RepID=UPI0011781B1B|nr:sporulation transcriptional regulator SpoIIID [Clostridium sp. HBUAS56017]
MKDYIVERTKEEANYLLSTNGTVRKTAAFIKVSRGTVHRDLVNRLPIIDMGLYKKVDKLLQKNFNEKHYRDGLATKRKYLGGNYYGQGSIS